MRIGLLFVVGALVASCGSREPRPVAEAAPVEAAPAETAYAEVPQPPPDTRPSAEPTVHEPRRDPLAALLDPSAARARAPEKYAVRFTTTKGVFEVTCTRSWAPKAADRFFNLVKIGYYDDTVFFRVINDPQPFIAQWGIHGSPVVNEKWKNTEVEADPVVQTNHRGTLTFAMGGSKTFTTQVFVNLADNGRLDKMGFAPLCEVDPGGMRVLDSLFGGHKERASMQQQTIEQQGNGFLKSNFPGLDAVITADVLPR
ncbi:MAG: peptidylprolyl isomerase [Polyangiaceae bacterium]|nr:peptidylprolyl isomerase [Polyangiaceae bacterium]